MKRRMAPGLQGQGSKFKGSYKIVFWAIVLGALPGLPSCTTVDQDKKTTTNAATSTGQTPTQQKPGQVDADEDEEGAPNSAAVVAEKAAPEQASGRELIYNFDRDPVGQLPTKFHSARTGQGSESTWAVVADPTAPSKPNVVAQTSTDKTDYRFPLLIADEASFRDLDLSVSSKLSLGGSIRRVGWFSV